MGCSGAYAGQVVVRGERKDSGLTADVRFGAVGERNAAEIRVVAARVRRPPVVFIGLDGAGDDRVAAVRADRHARPFFERGAVTVAAAETSDDTILDEDFLDGEPLADLRAGLSRRLHENVVEHRASRADRVR